MKMNRRPRSEVPVFPHLRVFARHIPIDNKLSGGFIVDRETLRGCSGVEAIGGTTRKGESSNLNKTRFANYEK
jgi:hypothetical protein